MAAKNVLDVVSDEEEELVYEDTYYLPVLYSQDKTGKERVWKIWVSGNTVHRVQGLLEGKKQTYERDCQGKNIGKKNETTPHEQAKQLAETTWISQIDKGYLPKCKEGKKLLEKIKKSKVETGGHNINASAAMRGRQTKTVAKKESLIVDEVLVPVKPMKAGIWEHSPNNPRELLPKMLKYFDMEKGFYMQYKLDGWRCIARLQKEGKEWKCVLTTNNLKQYPWFKTLRENIRTFILGVCENNPPESIILDGELYSHILFDEDGKELNDEARFSTISSMCGIARTEPHELEDQIQFVVFDLVDLTGKQKQTERMDRLISLFEGNTLENIVMCHTKMGCSPEDVIDYHNEASQKGYEGVMIRSRDLVYIQKRSLYIRKYKYFMDAEYKIVGVEKDDGVGDEYFVWVCEDPSIKDPKTKKPIRFSATPKADRETKKEWYRNYMDYVGKKATVRFQEYSQEKIPRFPIMVGIREDQ